MNKRNHDEDDNGSKGDQWLSAHCHIPFQSISHPAVKLVHLKMYTVQRST